MSKCSLGVNITMQNGTVIKHKYYSAEQLKDFVMSCDITDELKSELKKKRGGAIDAWVLSNQKSIIPQLYATQRITKGGKRQPPRMMSFKTYNEE